MFSELAHAQSILRCTVKKKKKEDIEERQPRHGPEHGPLCCTLQLGVRTTHARVPSPDRECAVSVTGLRMRQHGDRTTHAPDPRKHCGRPNSGTPLHMPERRKRSAHAPSPRPRWACAGSEKAVRTRFS